MFNKISFSFNYMTRCHEIQHLRSVFLWLGILMIMTVESVAVARKIAFYCQWGNSRQLGLELDLPVECTSTNVDFNGSSKQEVWRFVRFNFLMLPKSLLGTS
jgi:hypothetical protein